MLKKMPLLNLSKKCIRLSPSAYLFKGINWIISNSNHNIQKFTLVLGSCEHLERLEGKIMVYFYVKIFQNNSV